MALGEGDVEGDTPSRSGLDISILPNVILIAVISGLAQSAPIKELKLCEPIALPVVVAGRECLIEAAHVLIPRVTVSRVVRTCCVKVVPFSNSCEKATKVRVVVGVIDSKNSTGKK